MDLHESLLGIRNALILMALVWTVEAAIPLRASNGWRFRHLVPNLVLLPVTFLTGAILNFGVLVGLLEIKRANFGLINLTGPLPWGVETFATLVVLDFSWYVTHVSLHKIPILWRFHAVHHSDPTVDVTTTYRQHPIEGLVRYAYLMIFAAALGASPEDFALYRLWSLLAGQFAHANIRLPRSVDDAIALITASPTMHKVHHSRDRRYTDSNFSQIFSLWDRLFGTFTPAHIGRTVDYGIDGEDDPGRQTALALLTGPFG